jgi:hypothetical protein
VRYEVPRLAVGYLAGMGWDCTLQVVDVASLVRFPREEHVGGVFDAGPDADELTEKTVRLIAEDAKRGARAVGGRCRGRAMTSQW